MMFQRPHPRQSLWRQLAKLQSSRHCLPPTNFTQEIKLWRHIPLLDITVRQSTLIALDDVPLLKENQDVRPWKKVASRSPAGISLGGILRRRSSVKATAGEPLSNLSNLARACNRAAALARRSRSANRLSSASSLVEIGRSSEASKSSMSSPIFDLTPMLDPRSPS
jgi:hypothetical protein